MNNHQHTKKHTLMLRELRIICKIFFLILKAGIWELVEHYLKTKKSDY